MDPEQNQQTNPEIISAQPMPTQVEQKSFNWTKLLLIALGILVVVGIGIEAYYLGVRNGIKQVSTDINHQTQSPSLSPSIQQPSPTQPEQTTDWLLYNSVSFGISFSYPKNVEVIPETFDQIDLIEKGAMSPFIEVNRIRTQDTIDVWLQKGAPSGNNSFMSDLVSTNYSKSTTTFNGYPAFLFQPKSNHDLGQVPSSYLVIQRTLDNIPVGIEIISYETDYPISDSEYSNTDFDNTEKPIIAKILNSFKFTSYVPD